MEQNYWIAREKSGALFLYDERPKLDKTHFGYSDFLILDRNLFPDIEYENSPVQVEINIKLKRNKNESNKGM